MVLALLFAGCSNPEPSPYVVEDGERITVIYFVDGDSGEIRVETGTKGIRDDGTVIPEKMGSLKFQLNDIDAPETGGVGAAIDGAKCELERELGFQSKKWAVEVTRNTNIEVTAFYGKDQDGRYIVDLSTNGQDIGKAGLEAGVYRSWKHDGSKQLEPRPDWCGGVSRG